MMSGAARRGWRLTAVAMSTGSVQKSVRQSGMAGFTYIGLMILIAVAGVGLAAVGQIWHTEAQREREKELLFIGNQFRQAIGSFYESSPGKVKEYPLTLDVLVQDVRAPEMRHHLRRVYRDPMTGEADWGLVSENGRVIGVYSRYSGRPINQTIGGGAADNPETRTYSDWKFVFRPQPVRQEPQQLPEAGTAEP